MTAKGGRAGARRGAPPRRSTALLRRVGWPLLGSLALVSVLLVGVFPTRTYLSQRTAIDQRQAQLDLLTEEVTELEGRMDDLSTDEAIERLAREEYSLVYPGEEAYAILTPPVPLPDLPDGWPFHLLVRR